MRPPSSLLAACAVALLGAVCACQRNAPGPEECERFAQIAVQLAGAGPLLTPEVQAAVEQETRTCLTQPYDYDLLRCVSATHQWGMCMAAFRRRTGRSL